MNYHQDYAHTYKELEQIVDKYDATLTESFQSREKGLIKILEARAIQLKSSIFDLKKKTSQEAIDRLIGKKKQEKEGQRLRLEKQWRDLMEKLKRLQAEDKKIADQNKQASFDIKNLHEKIREFQKEIKDISANIVKQEQKKDNVFLTENQLKPYVSPYSYSTHKTGFQKTDKSKYSGSSDSLKLKSLRMVQAIPEQMLYEFLSKTEIKEKIFLILHS